MKALEVTGVFLLVLGNARASGFEERLGAFEEFHCDYVISG